MKLIPRQKIWLAIIVVANLTLWIIPSNVVELMVIFVLGTFLMRSTGCIINDLADRNFDGAVDRTKDRPLVTGAVSPNEALALADELGGYLVSVESPEEQAWLLTNFGADMAWLGIEYPHMEWVSGETVVFVNWREGEPSSKEQEPFAIMNWGSKPPGAWNDVTGNPNDLFRGIVEVPRAGPPKG